MSEVYLGERALFHQCWRRPCRCRTLALAQRAECDAPTRAVAESKNWVRSTPTTADDEQTQISANAQSVAAIRSWDSQCWEKKNMIDAIIDSSKEWRGYPAGAASTSWRGLSLESGRYREADKATAPPIEIPAKCNGKCAQFNVRTKNSIWSKGWQKWILK